MALKFVNDGIIDDSTDGKEYGSVSPQTEEQSDDEVTNCSKPLTILTKSLWKPPRLGVSSGSTSGSFTADQRVNLIRE